MPISLNDYTDEELHDLLNSLPIQGLTKPFKDLPNRYPIMRSLLGRGSKYTDQQKGMILSQITRLLRKQDPIIMDAVETLSQPVLDNFLSFLSKVMGHDVCVEDLADHSTKEIVDIVKDSNNNPNCNIDPNLLTLQLKLCGREVDENIRNYIDGIGTATDVQPESPASLNSLLTEDVEGRRTAVIKEAEQLVTSDQKNKIDHSNIQRIVKNKNDGFGKRVYFIKHANNLSKEKQLKQDNHQTTAENKKQDTDQYMDQSGIQEEVDNMKIYASRISVVSTFYNIMPFAEKIENSFVPLNDNQLDELLPQSFKRNINLSYSIHDEAQCLFMQEKFYDGQVVLFEFDTEELIDNITPMNERNQTGYKVNALDYFKRGKIRYLSDDGFFKIIDAENSGAIGGNIESSEYVAIKRDDIKVGEKIFVRLKAYEFCAGPYEIQFSSTLGTPIIKTKLKENKYVLYGYAADDFVSEYIEQRVKGGGESIVVYYVRPGATEKTHDVLDDAELLKSVKLHQSNKESEGESTEQLLKNYQESLLVGKGIPEAVQKNRVERAKKILLSGDISADFISNVSDILYALILENKDDKRAEELVTKIIERNPDLIDNVQTMRIIQDRINSAQGELESYQNEIEQLKDNIGQLREEERERFDQKSDNCEQVSKKEFEELVKKARAWDAFENSSKKAEKLKEETNYLEQHKQHLQLDTKDLETKFSEYINESASKMVEIAFDGFMSSKILDAASNWKSTQEVAELNRLVQLINGLEPAFIGKDELIDYLVSVIKIARPQYSKNAILNIFICITQGFLTVFAGVPGCGKTSICNMAGKVLGLNSFAENCSPVENEIDVNRFVSVSVERGWTSKRDFIGYYNPLTKDFEESNKAVFNGLKILDREYEEGINKYPYLILLDEANLSQMEYYWADFMNVCDDQKENHSINMGNNTVLDIPETLHFVATINNDNTIETLSPRLIDRAWIIVLPKNMGVYGKDIVDDTVKRVSWPLLKQAFGTEQDYNSCLDPEVKRIYEEIKKLYAAEMKSISSRSDMAIKHYCFVADQLMEEEDTVSPSIVSFDYAVSQKLLPTIMGNGDSYRKFLENLNILFVKNNMFKSSKILEEIIVRGDNSMKYYSFF